MNHWQRTVVGFCFLLVALLSPSAQAQAKVRKIEIRHIGPPVVSNEVARAQIRVQEGEVLDRATIDEDVRRLYSTGSFYNIRVTEETGADGVTLVYCLQGKPRIKELQFEGNRRYSAEKLRNWMTCKTGELLDERKLFADQQTLQTYYQKAGCLKTKVTYGINLKEETLESVVTFKIEEGPEVEIIEIVFDGAKAFAPGELRRQLHTGRQLLGPWPVGPSRLLSQVLEDDKERLSDFYRKAGYPDFKLEDIKYEYETTNRMRLHFVISEGRPAREK
jgi:outer membrane protein insertion porin family